MANETFLMRVKGWTSVAVLLWHRDTAPLPLVAMALVLGLAAGSACAPEKQVPATSAAGEPAGPSTGSAAAAPTVRLAVFNIWELSTAKITAVDAEGRGNDAQARAAAEIIQRVRPDVLVINEIDHDYDSLAEGGYALNARRFADNYLATGGAPLEYEHAWAGPSNTGILSGMDLGRGRPRRPPKLTAVSASTATMLSAMVSTRANIRWRSWRATRSTKVRYAPSASFSGGACQATISPPASTRTRCWRCSGYRASRTRMSRSLSTEYASTCCFLTRPRRCSTPRRTTTGVATGTRSVSGPTTSTGRSGSSTIGAAPAAMAVRSRSWLPATSTPGRTTPNRSTTALRRCRQLLDHVRIQDPAVLLSDGGARRTPRRYDGLWRPRRSHRLPAALDRARGGRRRRLLAVGRDRCRRSPAWRKKPRTITWSGWIYACQSVDAGGALASESAARSDMFAVEMRRTIAAWAVHLLTASGAIWGVLALDSVARDDARWALLWMVVAMTVDSFDGMLARAVGVKKVLPGFDGTLLDATLDYLNYAVVPAYFVWRMELVPVALGLPMAVAILLASAYQFCQAGAKTSDHFFKGFPVVLERGRVLLVFRARRRACQHGHSGDLVRRCLRAPEVGPTRRACSRCARSRCRSR